MARWFDLSPMRPVEWEATPADTWTEAVELRNAWGQGEADARDEAEMNRRLANMETVA